MADNTQRIAQIRSILESGVTSIEVGGEKTTFDLESLRKELRRLEEEDDAAKRKRPRIATMKLGGW